MIIPLTGLLIVISLFLAKMLTRWVANRPDANMSPRVESAQTIEDPMKLLQKQVDSKIHWDAPDYEVLDWLDQKHDVSGEVAQAMILQAKLTRKRAIRERAIYGLIFSGIGMVATGAPIILQLMGGFVFVLRSIVLIAAFFFSGFWFLKYTLRLLTGNTDVPIDS